MAITSLGNIFPSRLGLDSPKNKKHQVGPNHVNLVMVDSVLGRSVCTNLFVCRSNVSSLFGY